MPLTPSRSDRVVSVRFTVWMRWTFSMAPPATWRASQSSVSHVCNNIGGSAGRSAVVASLAGPGVSQALSHRPNAAHR